MSASAFRIGAALGTATASSWSRRSRSRASWSAADAASLNMAVARPSFCLSSVSTVVLKLFTSFGVRGSGSMPSVASCLLRY